MSKSGNSPLWFPCNMGMHQEYARTAAPPGTIYSCTNSRLDTSGVLVKRGGHVALAATTSVPSGVVIAGDGVTNFVEKPSFLTSVGDLPCIGTTAGRAFLLDVDSATTVFHYQGQFSTCKPVRKRNGLMGTVPGTNGYGKHPGAQAVNSSGLVCYGAVNDAGNRAHFVIETPTGIRIYEGQKVREKVQVLAVGATFYVVSQDVGGTAVRALPLTPDGTDVNVGSEVQVATLTSSTAHWDSSAYTATSWLLVHQSGAATMRVDYITGTSSTQNVTFAVTGTCPCSIWGQSNGNVWVGYYNDPTVSGDVRFRVYDSSAGSVIGETTIESAADVYGPPLFALRRPDIPGFVYDNDQIISVHRYVESGGSGRVSIRYSTITSGTPSAPVAFWGVLPICKPDAYMRVWALTDSSNSNFEIQRAVLLKLSSSSTRAMIELVSPPFAGTLGTDGPRGTVDYFHAIATASDRSYFGAPFVLTSGVEGNICKLEVYEYQTAAQDQYVDTRPMGMFTAIAGQPVELLGKPTSENTTGGGVSLGGAAEIGWLHPPVIVSAVNGGAVGTATHSYRCTYEWADVFGNRHQSAPSAPIEVTGISTTTDVDLVVTTAEITQRSAGLFQASDGPSIVFWRTVNGGTTYQRAGAAYGLDQTDGLATFTDQTTDANLSDEAALYTDGGVQQNDIAPSCRFFAFSENRLWVGGLWDPRIIQCSKVIVPNEQPAFTDHESHQVTLAAGECTGLAYMDGNVVAFTANEILVFGGDGPNNQGVGSFPPARRLAQGIGCIDYRSIVETDAGVFFQSKRGIELLPRGFGPIEYVGRAVKDVFQSDGLTEVIAAGVRTGSKDNTARFMVKDPDDSSTQTVLVYDIDRGEWVSKDRLHFACSNMGVWPDGFAWASTDFNSGTFSFPFLYENGSQFGDYEAGDTVYVSQTIQFNNIYPFGSPAHWGNVNKVQIYLDTINASSTELLVTIQTTDTIQVRSPTFTMGAATGFQRREVMVPIRQCSGVIVTLTESGSGSVAGHRFLGIALDVSTEGGIAPVNPNNNERA